MPRGRRPRRSRPRATRATGACLAALLGTAADQARADYSAKVTSGLSALTRIAGSEAGVDLLRVSTLGGDDDVTVAPDVGDLIATAIDLGADES